MKECPDFIRAMDKMMHSASSFQFHIFKIKHPGLTISPSLANLWIRIRLHLQDPKPNQ